MLQTITNLLISVAHAQAPTAITPPPSCTTFFGTGMGAPGQGFTCIADYIANLTFILIGFGASLSLVMLMINGFRYMVGPAIPGGSSDAAKKGIGAALTGLALSLLTYIILDTIVYTITSGQ
jgi:hypothetical protein